MHPDRNHARSKPRKKPRKIETTQFEITDIEVQFPVSATVANPEGITNPPIDELLDKTQSKYALVIFAAKRARQINAYYSQLGEGLLEYVGPLVETTPQEKPLSIALREINGNLLTAEKTEGE